MKKIALAAVAVLIASGAAYAGNDNVGGTDINQQSTANVDSTRTSSVGNTRSPIYKLLNPSGDVQKSVPSAPQGSGSNRDLFGNR